MPNFMEDKRKQFLATFKARAEEARNKAIAEGRPMPTPATNPMMQKLIERAKAQGVQPRPMTMQKMTREEMIERIKKLKERNSLKKKEE